MLLLISPNKANSFLWLLLFSSIGIWYQNLLYYIPLLHLDHILLEIHQMPSVTSIHFQMYINPHHIMVHNDLIITPLYDQNLTFYVSYKWFLLLSLNVWRDRGIYHKKNTLYQNSLILNQPVKTNLGLSNHESVNVGHQSQSHWYKKIDSNF